MPAVLLTRLRCRLWWLLVGLSGSEVAGASGGHHAVDDAAMVAVDTCELEVWAQTVQGRGGALVTVAPTCHAVGVDWGVTLEQDRSAGADAQAVLPAVKWATPLGSNLAAGIALEVGYALDPSRVRALPSRCR